MKYIGLIEYCVKNITPSDEYIGQYGFKNIVLNITYIDKWNSKSTYCFVETEEIIDLTFCGFQFDLFNSSDHGFKKPIGTIKLIVQNDLIKALASECFKLYENQNSAREKLSNYYNLVVPPDFSEMKKHPPTSKEIKDLYLVLSAIQDLADYDPWLHSNEGIEVFENPESEGMEEW